ncbi:hypothetical protein D3C85_1614760 [compost metagenome]
MRTYKNMEVSVLCSFNKLSFGRYFYPRVQQTHSNGAFQTGFPNVLLKTLSKLNSKDTSGR